MQVGCKHVPPAERDVDTSLEGTYLLCMHAVCPCRMTTRCVGISHESCQLFTHTATGWHQPFFFTIYSCPHHRLRSHGSFSAAPARPRVPSPARFEWPSADRHNTTPLGTVVRMRSVIRASCVDGDPMAMDVAAYYVCGLAGAGVWCVAVVGELPSESGHSSVPGWRSPGPLIGASL